MSDHPAGKRPEPGKAEHGTPSEVSWRSGAGRQPYANQGDEEAPCGAGGEFSEGDRGELSGRNVEQLEEARKMPGAGASQHAEQHQQENDGERDA